MFIRENSTQSIKCLQFNSIQSIDMTSIKVDIGFIFWKAVTIQEL